MRKHCNLASLTKCHHLQMLSTHTISTQVKLCEQITFPRTPSRLLSVRQTDSHAAAASLTRQHHGEGGGQSTKNGTVDFTYW